MIKYYPLSRVKTNLYTRGDEFVLPDGKSYSGRYYKTYNGQAYAGINPVLGTNQPLAPITSAVTPSTANTYNAAKDKSLVKPKANTDATLTEVQSYFPVPIQSDYNQGYFTRYFAKSVSGPKYVVEISQDDYSKIKDGKISMDILGYETTTLLWQLVGPLHDTRISQYQVQGGVYDTNKRVTEAKAKGFVGLLSFINGEYTKFAKIIVA